MNDQPLDTHFLNKIVQIKLRNNQYLPNKEILLKSHKKLSKSKSQFLNLSNQIKTNRNNIKSVNKALKKRKPVDYYDEGKYVYVKEIETFQKLYLDKLKNKNDKLEEKLKIMKNKVVKTPSYELNGRKNNKEINKKIINKEEKKILTKKIKKKYLIKPINP